MADHSKSPVLSFLDHAARAAHFEAAYLNQLEIIKALQAIIAVQTRNVKALDPEPQRARRPRRKMRGAMG